jgi:OmpA-OmpF porin, OOP family
MKKLNLLLIILTMIISTSTFAQKTTDIEGSQDYPTISRFEGAIIEFYKETKWGSYKLPVSEKGTLDWNKPMALDGKVTRIQYTVSKDNNSEFVLHNYKAGFMKSGYDIMIAIANEELGVSGRPHQWTEMYYVAGGYYNGIGNEKFGLGFQWPIWNNKQSFIVARGHDNGKDIYAIVFTIVTENFTLITQDVIEVEAVETGLVSVDNISTDITKKGHIAIYGIHFETGKSVLKPESTDALKTIADYINANTNKKFYIVGHTDNVGDFESNKTLSEERAKSVITELTTKYSVNSVQLKAYGIASLAPVFSNVTEEGKAQNRRVEIVEQ